MPQFYAKRLMLSLNLHYVGTSYGSIFSRPHERMHARTLLNNVTKMGPLWKKKNLFSSPRSKLDLNLLDWSGPTHSPIHSYSRDLTSSATLHLQKLHVFRSPIPPDSVDIVEMPPILFALFVLVLFCWFFWNIGWERNLASLILQ